MKRFAVAVVVAMSAFGLVLVGQAPASARHGLNGYHWTKPASGDRKIDVRMYHLQYEGQFRDAIGEWGKRTEFSFSVSNVDSNCDIPTDDLRLKVCDGDYGNTGWSGITDVILEKDGSKHISRGRLRLNTYYRMDSSIARSIWCHEAGHYLGLNHRGTTGTTSDDPDSCMSYHPASPQHPDSHDVNHVNCQTHPDGQEGGCGGGEDEDDGGCLFGIVCFGGQEQAYEADTANLANATVIRRSNGETLIRFYLPPPARAVPAPAPSQAFVAKTLDVAGAPLSMAFRCVW